MIFLLFNGFVYNDQPVGTNTAVAVEVGINYIAGIGMLLYVCKCLFVMTVQHVVNTSSSVTTQDTVLQHHGSVTVIMTVETGLTKTAVSDISIA